VVLAFARKQGHDLTAGCDYGARSSLITRIGRFPCAEGPAIAVASGLTARRIKGVVAVHKEGSGCRGIGEDIEGQHVDLCIPKNMSPIRLAGQTTCTDGHMFVGGVGRRDEVISCEAERALRFLVTYNPNLSGLPFTKPAPAPLPRNAQTVVTRPIVQLMARRVVWSTLAVPFVSFPTRQPPPWLWASKPSRDADQLVVGY